MNVADAEPVANLVMVRLGGGRVCVYAFSDTNVVIDLDGWFVKRQGHAGAPRRLGGCSTPATAPAAPAGEVPPTPPSPVDLGRGRHGRGR